MLQLEPCVIQVLKAAVLQFLPQLKWLSRGFEFVYQSLSCFVYQSLSCCRPTVEQYSFLFEAKAPVLPLTNNGGARNSFEFKSQVPFVLSRPQQLQSRHDSLPAFVTLNMKICCVCRTLIPSNTATSLLAFGNCSCLLATTPRSDRRVGR